MPLQKISIVERMKMLDGIIETPTQGEFCPAYFLIQTLCYMVSDEDWNTAVDLLSDEPEEE